MPSRVFGTVRTGVVVCAVASALVTPVAAEARVLDGTAERHSTVRADRPATATPTPATPRTPKQTTTPSDAPRPVDPATSPPVTSTPTPGSVTPPPGVPTPGTVPPPTADTSPEPASLACEGEVEVMDAPGRRWASVVVDPIRRLPDDWAPDDLRAVPELGYRGRPVPRVRADVAVALRRMHEAAAADHARFVVVSGFRSRKLQARLWDTAVEDGTTGSDAPAGTARPGHSEHQLGTTIDVVDPSLPHLVPGLVDTPAGRWLAANATDHGFVVSYPDGASDVTCFKPEPWHLRYVGPDVAAELVASGLTPREFLLGH